ncbi:MAG: leucine-rich repeat-containing protein kinase family protein [Rhodocyclaceae bacterium]
MTHTLERLRAGKLLGTRRLKLANGLAEFPREIFDLADSLEILDLSGNALSSLPDDLPRLGKLRIIFCSDNQFEALPEVLGRCPRLDMVGFKANQIREVAAGSLPARLRWLILTDNRIETLPAEIGNCRQLQKLMLAGNRLQTLPASLAACSRLELLRIAANRLREFPDVLLALPRLAWLAYAGNPFCAAHELSALAGTAIAEIDWSELRIGQPLGEGASGVIHQAEHHHADGRRAVAVKAFKGALTSDGLPRSEMAACIAAGEHANLIPALGKVKGHPTACDALVMPLIDPGFGNLAGPPSLESCTRDIYAAELSFAADSLLEIARGIASAAGHLHRRGILHGDLYGHNILHCGRGQPRALLGDFGAASFFAPGTVQANALQRLEVRAFGVLLAELIDRCEVPAETAVTETSRHVLTRLGDLKTACLDDEAARRPLFDEIERTLASLAG